MKSRVFKTFIGFLAALMSAAQEPTPNPAAFLVRISWSDIDLSPRGINKNDCLLVLPDGHFHMEERLQQLPEPRASLHIHESLLSSFQLKQLRSILGQGAVVNLPGFTPFALPVAVGVRRGLQVEISRNQQAVQRVGYMEWVPSKSDEASKRAVESLQRSQALAKSQEPAMTALNPLLRWFLDLKAQQLSPDSGKPNLCQLE